MTQVLVICATLPPGYTDAAFAKVLLPVLGHAGEVTTCVPEDVQSVGVHCFVATYANPAAPPLAMQFLHGLSVLGVEIGVRRWTEYPYAAELETLRRRETDLAAQLAALRARVQGLENAQPH